MAEYLEKIRELESTNEGNVSIAPGEIIIGRLTHINTSGEPCVDFPGNISQEPLVAMSTISISAQHIDKKVALLFAQGDLYSPVIMGIIHEPLSEMLENFNTSKPDLSDSVDSEKNKIAPDNNLIVEGETEYDNVLIDGNTITFNAKEKIELECGDSSITLTRAGKIIIKGKYLLNESRGVNRIRGGSVQLN